VSTRTYTQRARADAAAETRRRILDAAMERLRSAPTEPLSVDRVARDAGVARSTVYLVFGSRAGLFEAIGEDLLERTGFQRIVDAVRLPDPRDAVREGLRAAVDVYAAEREVSRTVYAMWALEPDAVRGAFEVVERGRAEGQLRLAQRLHDGGHLRPGLTVEAAADLLWVVTSFDTFDQLFTGRGLSKEQVAERLVALAEGALWGAAAS